MNGIARKGSYSRESSWPQVLAHAALLFLGTAAILLLALLPFWL